MVGGNRHVLPNIFKGIWLHIRDYIRRACSGGDSQDGNLQDTEYIPVKGRGIALTLSQWKTLKSLQQEIDKELDDMIHAYGNEQEDSKNC